MPTLSGLRRRGYTKEAIRDLCERVGMAKANSTINISLLEHCIREDLNRRAPRVMGVLRPLRLVIDNYPAGQVEEVEAENNPEDPNAGTRVLPFSRVVYVEQEDFMQDPPKQWFRLAPGREVRLKHAYYVTVTEVVKDETGQVVELHSTYDPASRGGWTEDGRKVRGTLHWVSADHALDAEVRLYEQLFTKEDPNDVEEGADFTANLNPNSLEVIAAAKVEPGLAGAKAGGRFQFLRLGYFCVDPDSSSGQLVFNRTATLRDTWAKIEKAGKE
jgi:glutaminyl-tRNA synthetase